MDQNRYICLNLPSLCIFWPLVELESSVLFLFYYFLFNLSQTSAHAQVQARKQCSLHSCCRFHIIHSDQQLVATQGNSVPVKADKKTATSQTWALTVFDLRCLQKSATRTHKYYINKEHCSEVLFLMAVKAKVCGLTVCLRREQTWEHVWWPLLCIYWITCTDFFQLLTNKKQQQEDKLWKMSRAKNELYVLIMCDNMYLLISEGWKPVGLMAALSSESFVKLSVVCF